MLYNKLECSALLNTLYPPSGVFFPILKKNFSSQARKVEFLSCALHHRGIGRERIYLWQYFSEITTPAKIIRGPVGHIGEVLSQLLLYQGSQER